MRKLFYGILYVNINIKTNNANRISQLMKNMWTIYKSESPS